MFECKTQLNIWEKSPCSLGQHLPHLNCFRQQNSTSLFSELFISDNVIKNAIKTLPEFTMID